MKKLLSIIFVSILLFSCQLKDKNKIKSGENDNLQVKKPASTDIPHHKTKLNFINKKVISFGKTSKNNKRIIKKKFYFKNTGRVPLVLLDNYSSCNCTKTKFSKRTIEPSDTAYIELVLDISEKLGYTRVYSIMEFNTKQQMYKVILQGTVTD